MKNLRKPLALILAVLMLLATLAACTPTTEPDETTGETTQTITPDETKPGSTEAKAEYSITVKSAGGLMLSGVNVYVYTDDTLEDLVNYATTDALGVAKITLKKSDKYVAVLSGMPEGYKTEACYP